LSFLGTEEELMQCYIAGLQNSDPLDTEYFIHQEGNIRPCEVESSSETEIEEIEEIDEESRKQFKALEYKLLLETLEKTEKSFIGIIRCS